MSTRPKRTRPEPNSLVENDLRNVDLENLPEHQRPRIIRRIEKYNPQFAYALNFDDNKIKLPKQYAELDKLQDYQSIMIADKKPHGLHTILVVKEKNRLYAMDPNHTENTLVEKGDFFDWLFDDYAKSRKIPISNPMEARSFPMQQHTVDGACSVIGTSFQTMYHSINKRDIGNKLHSNGLDYIIRTCNENYDLVDLFNDVRHVNRI